MEVVIFFIIQWYVSLFCQSFFQHRYAAHQVCIMSPFWEKFFYILCFLSQGSSYISAYAYGIMHRMHHVHTDTIDDPHSPVNSSNVFKLMWDTKVNYNHVFFERIAIAENYRKKLPQWQNFERFAHNWVTRFVWVGVYSSIWVFFATAWWQWLLLPMTIAMGSLQGAIVNYFAHKVGYQSYKLNNTSRNLFPFFDIFFWGEAYHNNHHKFAGRPNHAIQWFEYDPLYSVMQVMNFLTIIRLKKA
ncbi:MAG: fatty acid desaturase [Flammeovirgaceae bacterium]